MKTKVFILLMILILAFSCSKNNPVSASGSGTGIESGGTDTGTGEGSGGEDTGTDTIEENVSLIVNKDSTLTFKTQKKMIKIIILQKLKIMQI